MGRHVKRQTPKGMPSESRVATANEGLVRPFFVVGSRGESSSKNRDPDFAVHAKYRFATGGLDDFAAKHAVIFVHGYNVTTNEGLTSAKEIFSRAHASMKRDQIDVDEFAFAMFTWPGDCGTIYFNEAQEYAQHSGVALYELLKAANAKGPKSLTVVTHSLGAHVALRAMSILGERRIRGRLDFCVDRALLLGAAVENDVFHRPRRSEEYHFPEAAFGMKMLHIVVSRDDDVLGTAFRVNEFDKALGHSGPESMSALASLSRRVTDVLGGNESFGFEQHDFSTSSTTIINPDLHVRSHGGYWGNQSQVDYYLNLMKATQ